MRLLHSPSACDYICEAIIHLTQHTAHCSLTAHCTLLTIHYKLHNEYFTLHSANFTLTTLTMKRLNTNSTCTALHGAQFPLDFMNSSCKLSQYNATHTAGRNQNTAHYTLHTANYTLHAEHIQLHATQFRLAQNTAHNTLHTKMGP